MKYTTEELILAALTRNRAIELFDLEIADAEKSGEDMDAWFKKNSPYDHIADATGDFELIAEQIRNSRSA